MKSYLVILAFFTLSIGVVHAGETKPSENLPTLIDTALANNPELKSTQARWRMYTAKARQAGSLDDPMFMFKLQNMLVREPFVFNKDPQTAKAIGITQQLPFWGKRALKEEIAGYEAESYRWQTEERKLELKRMVTETYYQIYAVDKALEIIGKNIRIISDFTTIAESRYSVGQGAQQDIFKAGLEKSKMLDMQITLQQQRKSLEANLNYLLYRPAGTTVGTVADFELPKLDQSPEQLRETAHEKRPQIKSLIMQANKGMAGHRLARKEFYPDFNLSLEYMFREASMNDPGYNMFSLGVTFNLPFQQEKRRAMLAESSSETDMAVDDLNGLKNSIDYAINDSLAQMERRRKLVELYKTGIIPQAEQSLESAVISYRVGKVDFLTLLDGRLNLFNYEKELYESKTEYMMQLSRLEAAIGTGLVPTPAMQVTSSPAALPVQGLIPSPAASTAEHSHKH
jgi:cobalt-zinc-cadmium efflux system outer membrane protein